MFLETSFVEHDIIQLRSEPVLSNNLGELCDLAGRCWDTTVKHKCSPYSQFAEIDDLILNLAIKGYRTARTILEKNKVKRLTTWFQELLQRETQSKLWRWCVKIIYTDQWNSTRVHFWQHCQYHSKGKNIFTTDGSITTQTEKKKPWTSTPTSNHKIQLEMNYRHKRKS